MLKIEKLCVNDAGRYDLYLCQPNTTEKSLLASVELSVKTKPISIVRKLTAKRVESNLLLLECEVSKPLTSNDQFKFEWHKDNQPLQLQSSTKRITSKIVNQGKTCQLFIEKFDYLDSGVYEFAVYDTQAVDLKETTSFKLEIKQNPFKAGMKVLNTDLSEMRVLQVELETIPVGTIDVDKMKWFKNDIPIDVLNNDKFKFTKLSTGKFLLEIKNVCAEDNGSYQCNLDEFSNKLNLSGIEDPAVIQKPQPPKIEIAPETLNAQKDECLTPKPKIEEPPSPMPQQDNSNVFDNRIKEIVDEDVQNLSQEQSSPIIEEPPEQARIAEKTPVREELPPLPLEQIEVTKAEELKQEETKLDDKASVEQVEVVQNKEAKVEQLKDEEKKKLDEQTEEEIIEERIEEVTEESNDLEIIETKKKKSGKN